MELPGFQWLDKRRFRRQAEQIGPLELLILQGTPFCNLDCDYCYLPDRNDSSQMDMSVLAAVIDRVLEAGIVDKQFTAVWHAGEPMVLGIDFYEQAFALIADRLPDNINVNHSFQTNAVLINRQWCDFFKRHNICLGISVDGPGLVHDAQRKTRNGNGTHHRVEEAVDLLRQQAVEFHVIAVLTAQSIQQPDVMFSYFNQLGANQLCFNTEEIEGVHHQSEILATDYSQDYIHFFKRFHELRIENASDMKLREVDGAISSILSWRKGGDPSSFQTQETTPFKILNVAVNGDFSTWSPELLGGDSEEYGSFIFGNVMELSIDDCIKSPDYKLVNKAIADGVTNCKESCNYYELCGGGSPSNKLAELGRLDVAETAFCRLHKMACLDAALSILEDALGIESKDPHLPVIENKN